MNERQRGIGASYGRCKKSASGKAKQVEGAAQDVYGQVKERNQQRYKNGEAETGRMQIGER
jgi:uncharacterized protein YjbJ (UPF0337 family)